MKTSEIETDVRNLIAALKGDNHEDAAKIAGKIAIGVLTDIRRIADALEAIALNTQPRA